jgi:hypothetical protein
MTALPNTRPQESRPSRGMRPEELWCAEEIEPIEPPSEDVKREWASATVAAPRWMLQRLQVPATWRASGLLNGRLSPVGLVDLFRTD